MRREWMWAAAGCFFLVMTGCCGQRVTGLVADDGELMGRNKWGLAHTSGGPREALKNLLQDADGMVGERAGSVMDKRVAGPSGDKHDYVSYARYYWPNPKGGDLAWVSIDGRSNEQQIALGDANAYKQMLYEVHTLGVAYFYTGNAKYAQQAAKLARVWFLDPATRMNPNFRFAQAIPNDVPGRGIGLIEDRDLVKALDGLTLIRGSGAWTAEDERGLRAWVEAFDVWLTTSKEGRDEKGEANNHGSWYAVQEVGLDLYLGKDTEARAALEGVKRRIMRQIQPDGKQPLELAREDGYTYSVFNLMALANLAEMGRRNGVDLWHYELDNRTLGAAVRYMMPFASHEKKWPDKQIQRIRPGEMIGVVFAAERGLGGADFAAWLKARGRAFTESYVLLTGSP